MHFDQLWLTDFRTYESLELTLPRGLLCVVGRNGIGKTNLLEAVAYAASLESFRGAETSAMVRLGADRGYVRAQGEGLHRDMLVEIELTQRSRGRVQLNRQRMQRTSELLTEYRVTIFSPDDLELIKGSPSNRRDFLDDAMVARDPRLAALRSDLAKVLKQRNALLRQVNGPLSAEQSITLEVFDDRLAALGERLGAVRLQLVHDVAPYVEEAYAQLAGRDKSVALRYDPEWMETGLHEALMSRRRDEIRRGTSLVGPHRDDLGVWLGGLPSRSHASQGEQRSLALALRLGVHLLVTDTVGSAPILLLDDVFSELDRFRSTALFSALPPGQALLTSAVELPEGAVPDVVLRAEPGRLVAA